MGGEPLSVEHSYYLFFPDWMQSSKQKHINFCNLNKFMHSYIWILMIYLFILNAFLILYMLIWLVKFETWMLRESLKMAFPVSECCWFCLVRDRDEPLKLQFHPRKSRNILFQKSVGTLIMVSYVLTHVKICILLFKNC